MGRAEEALLALADLDEEVANGRVNRFDGRAENVRAWILRNLGQTEAADEHNLRGLEAATRVAFPEAQTYALLDLAEGRLLAGDLEAMERRLTEARRLQKGDQVVRWRRELRIRLLTARWALASGTNDDARRIVVALVEDARRLSVRRYQVLGELLGCEAALAAGQPVDSAAVERSLKSLPSVAGLEAWWLTAEVASLFGVRRWLDLAETRAAHLRAHAGAFSAVFEAHARTRLDRLRSTARVAPVQTLR